MPDRNRTRVFDGGGTDGGASCARISTPGAHAMKPLGDSGRHSSKPLLQLSRTRVSAVPLAVVFAAAVLASSAAAQEPDGSALYAKHCKMCHGATGVPSQGMKTMFPGLTSLADSVFLAARSEDSLVAVLNNGAGSMKPFKGKLTADEMAAVARFVKGFAAAPTAP
jgi:mono/diheme cytochrome c family protein